jgi:hypothetical protein
MTMRRETPDSAKHDDRAAGRVAEMADRAMTPADEEADHQLEVLIDQLLTSSMADVELHDLPPDFTYRILSSRTFAPWEVRQPRFWRLPALSIGALLAGMLGFALAPLWSLGPTTALALWARVLAVVVGRPVASLFVSGPLVVDALSRASTVLPGGAAWVLGGATIVAAGILAIGLKRNEREERTGEAAAV